MAVVASAISQNGKIIKPYVLELAETQDGQISYQAKPTVERTVNISQKTLSLVKEGMHYTATNGTAASLREVKGNSIAKTGSSDATEVINEVRYAGAHSWVVGCFDFQGENYCYAVMQEFAGRGYKTVPIIKKLINCVYTNFANRCDSV
jgi:cell division protein FtsI/penicillin-binding protein 2